MSATDAQRTFHVGRSLAVLAVVSLLIGLVALVMTLSTSPVSAQDAVARIPVSTATPYPFATTSTPWKKETARVDTAATTRAPNRH